MFQRIFAAAVLACLIALPGAASAFDIPKVDCALNEDNSELYATASNPSSQAYACIVSCRFTRTGQRAIEPFDCTFSLAANATSFTVCTLPGGEPDHFARIRQTQFTCQPR